MKSRSRLLSPLALGLLSVGWATLVPGVASAQGEAIGAATTKPDTSDLVEDKLIAEYQKALLEQAFQAVTAMPVKPHLKNRSRGQEAVVQACFELDQPRRALRYIEKIDDWRRGKGYADFAFYCAQHGDASEVRPHIDLAAAIAQSAAQDEDSQDWQIDSIKVAIAKTHVWQGQAAEAAKLQGGAVDFEAGKVEAVKAMLMKPDDFDHELTLIDATIAKGTFDQIQSALESCAQLFNRFFEDQERRARLEETIKSGTSKLPIDIRVELSMELGNFALAHQDRAKALELVQEARSLMDSNKWLPENRTPLLAKLAELRFKAGDEKQARADIDTAFTAFDAARDQIVNIWRARTLRPLAEAYQTTGQKDKALLVYKKAIEEGQQNPNSRPRAEDLSATCCSMALHAVEPDDKLMARIKGICEGLGQPW